jgi:linalool 8-monooxygenase
MNITDQEKHSLSSVENFQNHDVVHDLFTRMRAQDPVAWCSEPWGGPGFWSVTKYDDIQAVSKLPELFGSDQKMGGVTLPSDEMIRTRIREDGGKIGKTPEELQKFEGGRSMISMDPPDHNQHRRVVAPGFTPHTLDALESRIRERAVELLDRVKGKNEVEFVSAVAAELPIQMLAELFGVEQEMRHKLFEWSNILIGSEDPDIVLEREEVTKAYTDLAMFAMQMYQDRKDNPGDDLISMLVHSKIDGEPLSIPDYLSQLILLVIAGNETTRNSISGGVLALSQFPDQKLKLLNDRGLMQGAVDEIIRWVHPVIYMRRTAKQDATVGNREIKAGDKLALWYMSGNRDEDKWQNPFDFNITRDGPRHLSFGYGQHLCIGWRLAEIQLTVLLEELLNHYPDFNVQGDVKRLKSNFVHSIKSMQVTL